MAGAGVAPSGRMRLAALLVLCLGCATAKSHCPRHAGTSLVLDTTLGARAGELFAASDDALWLCRAQRMEKIARITLVSAVDESTGHDVDVKHTESLSALARHPEGMLWPDASCGLIHDPGSS